MVDDSAVGRMGPRPGYPRRFPLPQNRPIYHRWPEADPGDVPAVRPLLTDHSQLTGLVAQKGLAFGSKESMCMDVRRRAKSPRGEPFAPVIASIRGSRQ